MLLYMFVTRTLNGIFIVHVQYSKILYKKNLIQNKFVYLLFAFLKLPRNPNPKPNDQSRSVKNLLMLKYRDAENLSYLVSQTYQMNKKTKNLLHKYTESMLTFNLNQPIQSCDFQMMQCQRRQGSFAVEYDIPKINSRLFAIE